jgi:ribosomal protein S18 acetylase RimI-like enzyme
MGKRLYPLQDASLLLKRLKSDPVRNSDFLYRVFIGRGKFDIHSTRDMGAAMAVQTKQRHLIFWGEWDNVAIPKDLLPEKDFFVSSSPPGAIASLKKCREITGEWPCWHFLAPRSYGPGPWDRIGPIKFEEVPSISKHWTLSDDPEREMRSRVKKFDSACIRVRGRPVAWCGLHYEIEGVGNMGFAHTLDRHRRKGHAQAVTKALVNRLAARGNRATVHVIKDNGASIGLCRSLGFEIIGELTWASFGKKQ